MGAVESIQKNQAIIDNLCLDFLALIVLSGDRQRSRACARLPHPDGGALKNCFNMEHTTKKHLESLLIRRKLLAASRFQM